MIGALALLIAGELLGNVFLRALGGFGIGAALVAAVPAIGRLRPTITREIHPDRVERGQPALARLEVRNTSGRRQPAFTARDRIGDTTHEVAVRALPPGGSAVYHYELPTLRRGRVQVGPLDVERSDLLGLVRSRMGVGLVTDLRVYPRRHAVRAAAGGRARHHFEGPPPRQPMRGSMDLRSLREYVPGDELRHLHWKASARTGRLMVREYVDPAQPHCVVVLDTTGAPDIDEEQFEQAVEVAAALVREACERDQPTRLVTTSGLDVAVSGGLRSVRAMLDPLCEVAMSADAVPLDTARIGGSPRGGWLAVVTCSPDSPVIAELGSLRRSFAPFAVLAIGRGTAAGPVDRVIEGPDAASVLARWNARVAA